MITSDRLLLFSDIAAGIGSGSLFFRGPGIAAEMIMDAVDGRN